MTRYQKRCSYCGVKTKRIYIREYGVKNRWIPIGWKCEYCGGISLDNDKKYVPFEKYHLLEFNYKQLQRNMDKYFLEQE